MFLFIMHYLELQVKRTIIFQQVGASPEEKITLKFTKIQYGVIILELSNYHPPHYLILPNGQLQRLNGPTPTHSDEVDPFINS